MEKTKNLKIIIGVVLLILMSPAALATIVWSEHDSPYWLPYGTPDPHFIEAGESASAGSGAFMSDFDVVTVRTELLDMETGALVATISENPVTLCEGGRCTMGFETAEITDAHYPGEGDYVVRFTVSDGDDWQSKELDLFVTEDLPDVNHPPVLNDITDKEAWEGVNLAFSISGSDPDGDSITFSATNLPSGATFNPATRRFSWTPDYDQAGHYDVVFTVTDEHGRSDSQEVHILVHNVNRCPEMAPLDDETVGEGELLIIPVSASDADSDDSLTFSAVGLPVGASFDPATRLFSWTPGSDQSGTYTVTFRVSDGGCTDEETLRIVVNDDSVPSVVLTATPNPSREGGSVHFECIATGGDLPRTYHIDFGDGSSVDTRTADHVYFLSDTYTATCTVTDADADVASDSVDVVVSPDAPVVDLVITPASGDAPLVSDLICGVTGGNEPYTYVIDFGDGDFADPYVTDATSYSVRHTYGSAGSYVATCTVVDFDGDLGDDSEGVEVGSSSCPVLAPVADRVVTVGDRVSFTLSAFDADGDTIQYSADGIYAPLVGELSGDFSWTPGAHQTGIHRITFHAWDGSCDDSITVVIEVQPVDPGNTCPVANFGWSPAVPNVGESVRFTSTSTDADPADSLTCEWDFDGDGWVDSSLCTPSHTFDEPGANTVRLEVNDGECTRSIAHDVPVVGHLNVESISCLSPIIESRPDDPRMGSCTVYVEGEHGVLPGSVMVNIHYMDGTFLTSCVTDPLTGGCAATFEAPVAGNYTVYATAEHPDWVDDTDRDPTATFEVLERRYLIADLAVYDEPSFTVEDYDFFRGEDMYINFRVLDDVTLAPVDGMVTAVYLISPPGGVAEAVEYPHAYVPGAYWYHLPVPTAHDFLGDSQIFTFAFNFTDGSGESQVVEVIIRNNPPVINPAVADEFDHDIADTEFIGLTPYESDVEDCCGDLTWHVEDVDPSLFEVSVDRDDFMMVTPLREGSDVVTLVLTDLDGDTDMLDVLLRSGIAPSPECRDGVDNDGDGLVDWPDDPGCVEADDDDEFNVVLPQCSDGVDNDGDGSVDFPDDFGCTDPADDDEFNRGTTECSDGFDNDGDGSIDQYDPECDNWMDDDEDEPVVLPQCSDGIDNDGDGEIDYPSDYGCESALDDSEVNDGTTECSDGVDNDGDGMIDQDDPNCVDRYDDSEAEPQCSDGIDNDGDGVTDSMDPGCYTSGVYDPADDDETDILPECSDHFDNDIDGAIDWPADPGCADGLDDDESDDPAPIPECSNGVDDDGDGFIDLFDPGCTDADDDSEWNPPMSPQCSDGVDNDFDGLIDFPADPGCIAAGDDNETDPVVPPQCDDGVDNDGDGLVDMFDPGCTDPLDDNEVDPVVTQCSDGIDNDGDGFTDFPDDPDCTDASDDNEAHVPQCADGVDNDGDGLVDMFDPGCTDPADDDETDVAGNQPPVADIDLSRNTGAPGMVVNIDGSGSYDPDGVVAEYYWYVFAPDGTLVFDGWDTTAPGDFDFTAIFGEGVYEVRLVVIDDLGLDDTEVSYITVGTDFAQCDNGVDDDGDGYVDWPADPECSSADDVLEADMRVSGPGRYFSDSDDLLITRLNIDGYDIEYAVVAPGESIRVSVGLQNNLDYDLDDIRVETSVYDLGLRRTKMVRQLEPDESARVVLEMEVPYDAMPGIYDLRVAASNDDVRRVKYRTIAVV